MQCRQFYRNWTTDEQRVALKTFLYSWRVFGKSITAHIEVVTPRSLALRLTCWTGKRSDLSAINVIHKVFIQSLSCFFFKILFCPQKYQNFPQVEVGLVLLSSIAVILCVKVTKTLLFNILFPHADKLDHVGRRVRFRSGEWQFTKTKTYIFN